MKEYYEDGVKVIEYSYKDWEEGKISGSWKPGKELVRNTDSKESYYQYLPFNQYQRIEEKRKRVYWEEVDRQFTYLKKQFVDKYRQSSNSTRLLDQEINRYESLFFSEKLPLTGILTNDEFPIDSLNMSTVDISGYRKLYEKLIVRGQREYHFTNSPSAKMQFGSGDYHFKRVDALAKYLTWLQNFDTNKILMEEINTERLKPYMANLDYDFYLNTENIPNHDLVYATIEHFEDGPRKGIMQPLDFLNLLWKQKKHLTDNIDKPYSVYQNLMALPLPEELRHILFGFIIKWLGGYPINNLDTQYDSTLRLIEKEFLKYPKDTPEKKICQKDWDEYKRVKQMEKLTNAIFNGKEVHVDSVEEKANVELESFTNSQVVLIFYFFFKYAGIEPRKDLDVAPIAKFIHLITGKNFTGTANSDVYKKLQKAPNFKTDKALIEDLKDIKSLFMKVELNEIVKMIDNEIDIARSEIGSIK